MKKISTLLLLLFLIVATTFAQESAQTRPSREQRTPEERAEAMTARMTKELPLNADQSTKIRAINLEQAKKMEAIRQKNGEDRAASHSEFKALSGETDTKYKEVLTAEQFTKYQQQEQEKTENRRDKMKERKSGAR